ncbi:hypothetical protein BAUCODRAFT_26673 [Baudoinia panamericana UAMH 10762]|uniref:Uncharacterized protein n=1 Tax=Baudoinia panamericana (strain UAMH 10762) TaxID=717646 RepID=M2N3S9_BAUPA|nr:uncharacterized protein BAUCODRAFT_26673 [Baudoinia panamericana UAMH 10762]EMC93375.1 hypothetical protein BAUCODRAFT_26673 [Baudoinia panamericana UAMH 10762]
MDMAAQMTPPIACETHPVFGVPELLEMALGHLKTKDLLVVTRHLRHTVLRSVRLMRKLGLLAQPPEARCSMTDMGIPSIKHDLYVHGTTAFLRQSQDSSEIFMGSRGSEGKAVEGAAYIWRRNAAIRLPTQRCTVLPAADETDGGEDALLLQTGAFVW